MSRINVKKPGPLSNFERKIFRDKVEEFDSNYRVKVGSVPTVVGLALNPGAIVLSEADGLLYACTATEWTRAGLTFPLDRNEDIVLAGGYDSLISGTSNISAGPPNRDVLIHSHKQRIRQNGFVEKVSVYIGGSAVDVSNGEFYFRVWRKNGSGNYDLVGEENVISKLTPTSFNTVTLDNPIEAQEGDFVGWNFVYNPTSPGCDLYAAGAGQIYYGTSLGTSDVDFEAASSIALNIATQVHMQAPLISGIGDSIMAGHPSHYSFIETNDVTDLSSQIMYQLGQLSAEYVYQNMGIGSEASSAIAARIAADMVDLKPRYGVVIVGVNDIASSVLKASYLANMSTILTAITGDNIKPIICKIFPWSNGSNAQMQSRDDWMTDLQSLVSTFAGSIWIDMDSVIGEFRSGGDAGNLWDIQAAYDADGVHLNEAGYTKVAETIDNLLT